MPLIFIDRLPVREIFPGLRARLIHSDRVSHSWVDIDAGATFPEHHHPHEQIVRSFPESWSWSLTVKRTG